ncbi:MAG: RIP metalloprotease RseP, partial [Candidatus Sericytochromatia bacterium]|nr:RIP metalloprotease RseP [Candidatus Sericytochromatia bacterium]
MAQYLGVVVILGMLIVLHELGHFSAAKWLGVSVKQFAVGFGPALWTKTVGETDYRINAIPLRGYCAFLDDENRADIPAGDQRYIANRKVWERALIISGGVIMNAITAYLVMASSFFAMGVPTDQVHPGLRVGQVMANMPAKIAGLQPMDKIMAVDGKELKGGRSLQELLKNHKASPVALTVHRANTDLTLTVTPTAEGKIGVEVGPEPVMRPTTGVLEPFTLAGTAMVNSTKMLLSALGMLVTGQLSWTQVGGPIGVVKMGGDVAKADWTNLYTFTALISLELAIINFLPLPALDGGHLMLLIIEKLRGRPLPRPVEDQIMQGGLLTLLFLGVLLIFKDVVSLVTGEGPGGAPPRCPASGSPPV